jgi:phage portal protein BeeE
MKFTVRSNIVGSILETGLEAINVQRFNFEERFGDAEASHQPQTGYTGAPVPWPLNPAGCIEYWYSSPWLSAIGNVLADAVSAAKPELVARSYDVDGREIKKSRKSDRQYAQGMAWLLSEDFALDGISALDFAGFRKVAALHLDQTGNLFVEVMRNRAANQMARLGLLLPQYLTYALYREGDVAKRTRLYQLDPWQGERFYELFGSRRSGDTASREFLHMRLPNTVSNTYGLPAWISSRDSVEVDNNHRKYLKSFFANHAAPRWILEVTQNPQWTGAPVTDEEIAAVYASIQNYLGANRGEMSGRNLLLCFPGGMQVKATPMDSQVDDPTFGVTARNARDEILAVRHISWVDLGMPEGTNRATAEQQSDNFRKHMLEPFAAPIVTAINRLLHAPPPFGLGITQWDLVLEYQDIEAVLTRIEGVTKATGRPVLTGDEGREILGYEQIGDETLYVPANLIPIGSDNDQDYVLEE